MLVCVYVCVHGRVYIHAYMYIHVYIQAVTCYDFIICSSAMVPSASVSVGSATRCAQSRHRVRLCDALR